jgi:hypothetical protein
MGRTCAEALVRSGAGGDGGRGLGSGGAGAPGGLERLDDHQAQQAAHHTLPATTPSITPPAWRRSCAEIGTIDDAVTVP